MRIETSTKIVLMFAATALAFTIADAATTYVAVSNGLVEVNPIIASDIASYGLVSALLITVSYPVLASIVCVSGTTICNRIIMGPSIDLSMSKRKSLKLFISIMTAFLLTVVILIRGWAVCNNIGVI